MKPPRRYHHLPFKLQIINECAEPGATIAGVAQRHSLNANLVHKWLVAHGQYQAASAKVAVEAPPGFIPIKIDPPPATKNSTAIRIEVPHPRGTVVVSFPVEHAGACAAVLAEVLK